MVAYLLWGDYCLNCRFDNHNCSYILKELSFGETDAEIYWCSETMSQEDGQACGSENGHKVRAGCGALLLGFV